MDKTNQKRKKTFIIKKSKVVLRLVQSLERKNHGSVIYAKDDEPELIRLRDILSNGYHHKKRQITMEDRRILKEHQSGITQLAIADKHHCSTCKIYNSLKKFHVHCGKTHEQSKLDNITQSL